MAKVLSKSESDAARAFSFADFERRAQQIIADAEARGRQIVAKAEQLARTKVARLEQEAARDRAQATEAALQEARRSGHEQAHAEAREAAIAAARSHLAQTVKTLRSGLEEFNREKRGLLAVAESGLITLAVAIARRVCKCDLDVSAESARANARTLLDTVANHDDLVVHLNPDDHALLPEVAAELAQASSDLDYVEIRPDPAVDRGGCIVRTRDGCIDATLETQLQRVADAICLRRDSDPGPPQAGAEAAL